MNSDRRQEQCNVDKQHIKPTTFSATGPACRKLLLQLLLFARERMMLLRIVGNNTSNNHGGPLNTHSGHITAYYYVLVLVVHLLQDISQST